MSAMAGVHLRERLLCLYTGGLEYDGETEVSGVREEEVVSAARELVEVEGCQAVVLSSVFGPLQPAKQVRRVPVHRPPRAGRGRLNRGAGVGACRRSWQPGWWRCTCQPAPR